MWFFYVFDGFDMMMLMLDGEKWGKVVVFKKQVLVYFSYVDYWFVFIGERTFGLSMNMLSLEFIYDFQSNKLYIVFVFGLFDVLEMMVVEDIESFKNEIYIWLLYVVTDVGLVLVVVYEIEDVKSIFFNNNFEYG